MRRPLVRRPPEGDRAGRMGRGAPRVPLAAEPGGAGGMEDGWGPASWRPAPLGAGAGGPRGGAGARGVGREVTPEVAEPGPRRPVGRVPDNSCLELGPTHPLGL